jgi:thiol-disulfide isomerase/thioredoxin/dienelactone hydrolase
MNQIIRLIVTGALLAMATTGAASETRELQLPDRSDVSIRIEPATGDTLLLWLPSGIPVATHDADIAQRIARLGIEVWRPDVLEAHFLPNLESSLAQVPDSDIAVLVDAARATGKRVVLLAAAHAAALALRGAHAWQTLHPGEPGLIGAILLHPYLYLGPPEPGRDAEFHPVVRNTSLPVVIVQPGNSPTRFRVDALRAALEEGGARVQVELLPGVRDRYYFRADATPAEDAETARLPARLKDALATMSAENGGGELQRTKRPAPSGTEVTAAHPASHGLQPYDGDPAAPALALVGLDGRTYDLARYRGRVVLVNFWASWCPPCVREMPSMQRLEEKLRGKPFAILAVNTAESPQDVRAFLGRHHVSLPVMIDPDGRIIKRWKVFVFPTSFVIDAEGRIRLGVYGEVAWDAPETVGKITALLPIAR